LLTWAISIVGLVASVIALYEFVEKRQRRHVSWRKIEKLVKELLDRLEDDSFSPDLILGVGRGGSIIAAMIATNLPGRIQLACLDTEAFHDEPGRMDVILRRPDLVPPLAGREVLVVVAELYSGQDLRDAVDFVEAQHPRAFKTLTVLTGPGCNIRPHYEGMKTKHEPRAPWRITDAGKRVGGRI
jgi:hypoxanthine phosphoribosyltransferase